MGERLHLLAARYKFASSGNSLDMAFAPRAAFGGRMPRISRSWVEAESPALLQAEVYALGSLSMPAPLRLVEPRRILG